VADDRNTPTPTPAARPHALYRFFGPAGDLLYVGITNNPARRFAQHGVSREWWLEVETIRMERFPTREAVLAAEKRAIVEEHPKYNVMHAVGPHTSELPESSATGGSPGDYPVNVGEVVALGLSPTPLGEQSCPVGIVIEVNRMGLKLGLLRWHIGFFDGGDVLVPWSRIMEIHWAPEMDECEIQREGYAPGSTPMFDTDKLAYFQTSWTHGRERARQNAIDQRSR
jgi:hypothetical protein